MITDPSETQPISSDSQTPETPMQTPPPQMETQAPAQAQPTAPVKQGTSEDTKTIVTVLLLIFVFPIGLIVMFFWPKWKWWVKLLVAFPVLALGFLLVSAILLVAVNPSEQIERAECVTACQSTGATDCVAYCADSDGTYQSTPSMDETDSTQQKFTNEELGFTVTFPSEWPQLEMRTETDRVTFYMPLQTPYQGATEQVVFWVLKDFDIPENPGPFYQRVLQTTATGNYVFMLSNEGVVDPDSVDYINVLKIPEGDELFNVVKAGFEVTE